jgi:phosphatidate cytidylyltransferase
VGFFIFIKSLTKGYYTYQFRSYAWIHIILFIFGFTSSLIIANIFNGLIWFILPASLVICNDISAYIFGRMFGRTPLSPLSPKKTVEGFIGGLFATLIWCYIVNYKYNY